MFDWHLILAVISGVLGVYACVPYIKDILHGTTRPNIVSWALWVLIFVILISAQVTAGASWSLVFVLGDFIGTTAILVLAIVGHGYTKYGKTEWACLTLAIIAIVLWRVTHQPILAIVFSIIADMMASVPTVVKAYKDPWSEHPDTWFLVSMGAILGIVASKIFNTENLAFPIWIFFINGLIGCLAFFGRRLKHKHT